MPFRRVDSRIAGFLSRQVREVRFGGIPVLLRKVRALANNLGRFAVNLVALVLVLLIRVLRPLVVIRIGALASNRIGHYALDAELYLCERDAGLIPSRTFDVFYDGGPVCNQQLRKMWRRRLRMVQYVAELARVNRWLPKGDAHVVTRQTWVTYSCDMHQLIGLTEPHLTFTPEEILIGEKALREMGIPKGMPYVCFHARDQAYLQSMYPGRDWGYHDFRDSNIDNYISAAEELVGRGYSAVRMGAVVSKPIAQDTPGIVDYASSSLRSDFLDVFLIANCRFFLGADTGLAALAATFRRPLAVCNSIPIEHAITWMPGTLLLPKKLWLKGENRFLTFREAFKSGVAWFGKTEQYKELDIEVVENTQEEIIELAIEMDERLRRVWQEEKGSEELQRRFWEVFETRYYHGPVVARVGTRFLARNDYLLG
jgi:putative glycosyltransferase (TIGR04372 family)